MISNLQIGNRLLTVSSISMLLVACAAPHGIVNDKLHPQNIRHSSLAEFVKSDFDHLADVEMRQNTQSLRTLMTKLYKRNPKELRKSTAQNAESMVQSVFENQLNWRFSEINKVQGTDAIQQALHPDFTGDRVLSLIVGMQTMLIKAHGGKSEFYFIDSIDPQKVYNAARNFEIAVWKLSNTRDANGNLLLLSNEINATERNLSFEREFGKIIGNLDLYAITLSEKLQRNIIRVVQTFATALFLPF